MTLFNGVAMLPFYAIHSELPPGTTITYSVPHQFMWMTEYAVAGGFRYFNVMFRRRAAAVMTKLMGPSARKGCKRGFIRQHGLRCRDLYLLSSE